MFQKSRRIYLDYAAATPLSRVAKKAMRHAEGVAFANPSALHREGQRAKQLLEDNRVILARTVGVRPEFVTFTSGGTESNNLAIIGTIEALQRNGRPYTDMEIVTTATEHPSVGETLAQLVTRGVTITVVPVINTGQVEVEALKKALSAKTVLVTTSYINSEVGTIQPLHRIRKVMKEAEKTFGTAMYLHVDAAQAPLWSTCQFDALDADLLSLDFGKCGGPKGSGALVRHRRVLLTPVLFGGGQESGLRPGTEPFVAIAGGVAAFVDAQKDYKARAARVRAVRDVGIKTLLAIDAKVVLNGASDDERVANNINISILGTDTEYLAVVLDTHGIAVSTKSACAGAGGGASAVVLALTGDTARASSTLRLTLGPDTTVRDIERAGKVIRAHLALMAPWQT